MQVSEIQHITKTPGVCGGKACIAGHRIRVMDVAVWHEMRGYSPDEIVDTFPGITLADVYAALAYYFDHRAEIDADFKRDEELAEKLRPLFPLKATGKAAWLIQSASTSTKMSRGRSHTGCAIAGWMY